MNKHQKEKSREIRDIMRSDTWGRMTYKEAKRKWRNGIRAFRVGDTPIWKSGNMAHLGFSRSKLREAGQAYLEIIRFRTQRGLEFTCEYDPYYDVYLISFSGTSSKRNRFCVVKSVSKELLQHCSTSLGNLAEYILEKVDAEIQKFDSLLTIKPCLEVDSIYPQIILPPGSTVNEDLFHGGFTTLIEKGKT